jgi:hypothetical protein
MNVAKTNSDKKGVRIYDKSDNFLETTSKISAPTMQVYNYGETVYTSLKALGMDDVTIMDYIKVLVSNIISTREYRSAAIGDMEKAIQLNEMREKRQKSTR